MRWKSLSNFKRGILQFVRPSLNNTYNSFSNKKIKHITRLHLGLSNLCGHKFKHDFLASHNPICSCGLDIEITYYYLFHCLNFTNERSILLNIVSGLNKDIGTSSDATFVKVLLHGDKSFDLMTNTLILNAYVDFLLLSKMFDSSSM